MLCLADRNFYGFELWNQAKSTGVDLLWRVKKNLRLPCEKRFPDGSYLSRVYAPEKERCRKQNGVVVRVIDYKLEGVPNAEAIYRLLTTILDHEIAQAQELAALYYERWEIGVSSKGHITQSVKVRPRVKDSALVAWEVPWRETKTVKPSDNIFFKENMQHARPQRTVNADVASLHSNPVVETVYNARRQQGLIEMNPMRQFSPAGYQRWHGMKGYVETGEALDTRRRNLVEEASPITLNGKWMSRYQGGGLGRSTADRCAAKRIGREGPRLMSIPDVQSEAVV